MVRSSWREAIKWLLLWNSQWSSFSSQDSFENRIKVRGTRDGGERMSELVEEESKGVWCKRFIHSFAWKENEIDREEAKRKKREGRHTRNTDREKKRDCEWRGIICSVESQYSLLPELIIIAINYNRVFKCNSDQYNRQRGSIRFLPTNFTLFLYSVHSVEDKMCRRRRNISRQDSTANFSFLYFHHHSIHQPWFCLQRNGRTLLLFYASPEFHWFSTVVVVVMTVNDLCSNLASLYLSSLWLLTLFAAQMMLCKKKEKKIESPFVFIPFCTGIKDESIALV